MSLDSRSTGYSALRESARSRNSSCDPALRTLNRSISAHNDGKLSAHSRQYRDTRAARKRSMSNGKKWKQRPRISGGKSGPDLVRARQIE